MEVQFGVLRGSEKRVVYYGCGLYVDQLRQGDDYARLRPAFSVWLLDGILCPETPQLHHAFRLVDAASGRVLDGILAIHTLELPNVATQRLSTLTSFNFSLWSGRMGIAVDGSGNVFIGESDSNRIVELPRAYAPGGSISAGAGTGSDTLTVLLPAGESLAGILAPSSSEGWLTIDSVSGGVVHFSFTQDTGATRTAHIVLLGQQIAVMQWNVPLVVTAVSPSLGPPPGGTTVTITGAGFATATAVYFGSTPATRFTIDSPTQITATNPAGTGTVQVTVITSSGAASTATILADQFTYNPWVMVGTGDFNRDKKADVLWQDQTTGEVAVWTTGGATQTLGHADPAVWSLAGVGDFNGDGKADVLWQDVKAGDAAYGNAGVWITGGALQ